MKSSRPLLQYREIKSVSRGLSGRLKASQSMYSGLGSFSHWPVSGFFLLRPTANRNFTTVEPLLGRTRGASGLSVNRPISSTSFSLAMTSLQARGIARSADHLPRKLGEIHFPHITTAPRPFARSVAGSHAGQGWDLVN